MSRARGAALEGPPFAGARQKTALPACDRYALAQLRKQWGEEPCQAVLRFVVQAGLESLGWSEDRRKTEYAHYVQVCAQQNITNEFEGR